MAPATCKGIQSQRRANILKILEDVMTKKKQNTGVTRLRSVRHETNPQYQYAGQASQSVNSYQPEHFDFGEIAQPAETDYAPYDNDPHVPGPVQNMTPDQVYTAHSHEEGRTSTNYQAYGGSGRIPQSHNTDGYQYHNFGQPPAPPATPYNTFHAYDNHSQGPSSQDSHALQYSPAGQSSSPPASVSAGKFLPVLHLGLLAPPLLPGPVCQKSPPRTLVGGSTLC
ncbi:MAG: hypothetical protein Q9217_006751 [Psora testacea]